MQPAVVLLPPSLKKKLLWERVGKAFSILIRFVENTCNIYIFKKVYYENIFDDIPNNTNYVP